MEAHRLGAEGDAELVLQVELIKLAEVQENLNPCPLTSLVVSYSHEG
jgi:hypothetical protein